MAHLEYWRTELLKKNEDNTELVLLLVGNKADLLSAAERAEAEVRDTWLLLGAARLGAARLGAARRPSRVLAPRQQRAGRDE